MRKFIVLLLLLAACCIEVNAQYMTARSIIVIKDNSRKEAKEAAKAEKEAAAKAEAERKAQEEARLAAEREAAVKAEAERQVQEQARLTAEREVAAKAKAEEQARLAAKKEAEAKAKAEEQARLAAESKATSKVSKGYDQYINLSYGYNKVSDFIGLNYIAGYRFNHLFFLGAGTGIDFALFTPAMEERFANCKPTRINIPVYANFRTNFLNKAWSPYLSIAAGARLSPVKVETDYYSYVQSGLLGDISLGVERRIDKKASLYLGVGYRIESFLGATIEVAPDRYNITTTVKYKLVHGFNAHIGLSF